MWKTNDDGGGAAWRDILRDEDEQPILRDGAEVPVVRWKKGLMTEAEMQEMAATLPIPFILHFRIQTCGGIRADMTHPFPVYTQKELKKGLIAGTINPIALEGQSERGVLFHNGHWSNWQDTTFKTAGTFGIPLGAGPYSDSRAMAYAVSVYGQSVLEFIDEKAVLFQPNDMDIFKLSAWKEVEKMWCSNDLFNPASGRTGGTTNGQPRSQQQQHYWPHSQSSYQSPTSPVLPSPSGEVKLCIHGTCGDPRIGNTVFCAQHQAIPPLAPTAEEVKSVARGLLEGAVATGAVTPEVAGVTGGDPTQTPFAQEVAKIKTQRTLVKQLDGKDVMMSLAEAEEARFKRFISKSEVKRVKRLFKLWEQHPSQRRQWTAHVG